MKRFLNGILTSVRYSSRFQWFSDKLRYTEREDVLRVAMEFAAWHKLDGDYLEFGVAEGATLARAFHFARRNTLNSMRFHAFDSFEGLPPVEGLDAEADGEAEFHRGQYSFGLDEVKSALRAARVDLERCTFTQGWFEASLTPETRANLGLERAAVIWVDCDLYESTVPVLAFVTDLVRDGTVILFDDWFCFRASPDRGEQLAFREWLERNPDITATPYKSFGWHGQSFILHRATTT